MKNEKTKIGVLLGVMVVAVVMTVGVTFALWQITLKQETTNTITTGCFLMELKDKTAALNLERAYPIPDAEGMAGTSYDFTITNSCAGTSAYSVNLEVLKDVATGNSKLENLNYIRMLLNEEGATVTEADTKLLTSNTVVDPTLKGENGEAISEQAYELVTGTLNGAGSVKEDGSPDNVITYQLRLWLDKDTPAEDAFMNKTFQSKITVIGSLANNVTSTPDPEPEATP